MKLRLVTIDGQFWIYCFVGPLRFTLFRSHLFHPFRRRAGFPRQFAGVAFDVFVLAALATVGALIVWHFGSR